LDEKEDVVLKIDEALFGIAIKNLIENALKYSEDEVIVKISKEAIEVEDRGIGIESKDIDKITSKFYILELLFSKTSLEKPLI